MTGRWLRLRSTGTALISRVFLVEVKLFRAVDKPKEFTGMLKAWDKDTITLEFEEGDEWTVERSNIALIRLAFDF